MLYMTTRDDVNLSTAHKALVTVNPPDGGEYVPYRFPQYTPQDIKQLENKSFFQTVEEILGQFFSLRLDNGPLISDYPVFYKTLEMSHRAVIAELWQNRTGTYKEFESHVIKQLATNAGAEICASEWPQIALRIAVFFALYGEMLRCERIDQDQTIDISVWNDDFVTPIAALYCRKMGLPINMIICTCGSDNDIWDFIHKGTVNTTMLSDLQRNGLERLIHMTLGMEESRSFANCCSGNKTYTVDEEKLSIMNMGLFCVVAGKGRSGQVINSLFRMNTYIADNHTALAYGGLQDYRAKLGGSGSALRMSYDSPQHCLQDISAATGLDENTIRTFL